MSILKYKYFLLNLQVILVSVEPGPVAPRHATEASVVVCCLLNHLHGYVLVGTQQVHQLPEQQPGASLANINTMATLLSTNSTTSIGNAFFSHQILC